MLSLDLHVLFGQDFIPDYLPDATLPIYPRLGLTLELHWCLPPTLDELFSNEANTKLTSNLDSRSNDDII